MILSERHIILPSNKHFRELDDLCFKSKNLYNSALYYIRQQYFKDRKYVGWMSVNREFVGTHQPDYYALPAKVSQQTLKSLHQNMRSFFSLLKNKTVKNKLPNYLDKERGRMVVTYTNQAISKSQLLLGFINPSKTNVLIKTKVKNVQQVRIVPKLGYIVLEVLYKVNAKEYINNNRCCGVDLGVNNLMACSFNDETMRPMIINGKPLKSINQFYNKEKAKLQSRDKTSNRLRGLHRGRNNKVSDYLHKVSRAFINYLVSNDITNVYVGYNKEWKQGINIGKVNNQNFVSIPFERLLQLITYKANLCGIMVNTLEESYTSKCSFLDGETIKKQDSYLGARIKRGLFRSQSGKLINSDINGSYNILKKAIGNFNYNPIEVCSTPLALVPLR